jgi:hypothetical protein
MVCPVFAVTVPGSMPHRAAGTPKLSTLPVPMRAARMANNTPQCLPEMRAKYAASVRTSPLLPPQRLKSRARLWQKTIGGPRVSGECPVRTI